MRALLSILLFALGLAGCTQRDAARSDDANTAARAAAPADTPPDSSSAAAPATAPSDTNATPARTASEGPMPALGTIGYAGFGPAKFGATQEEVRMAWGRELAGTPSEPGGCYFLRLEPKPEGHDRIAFMFEADKFVRIDVDEPGIAAPGGGEVGMSADEIRMRYPGIQEQPHKYVEGAKNLRHADADGRVLLFETDPAGRVTRWRVGVPPQVDYVEGCG